MPLHQYGVLKGRPIQKRLGMGQSPHYQIHIVDDETDYRIAIICEIETKSVRIIVRGR